MITYILFHIKQKRKCKTRKQSIGCVPQARHCKGDLCLGALPDRPPGQRPPWTETPRQRPPRRNMESETQRHRPPEGTWNPQKEREIRDRDPATRKMGSGNKTVSDVIHRPPPPSGQTPVKALLCPKLRLRAVIIHFLIPCPGKQTGFVSRELNDDKSWWNELLPRQCFPPCQFGSCRLSNL